MSRRRITVADHERFQRTGQPPHLDDIDLDDKIDLDVPNPPAMRSKREANRVLAILDELNREGRTK